MRMYWVTNMPTPYRNHQHEKFLEHLPDFGITFEVLFMSWESPTRPWHYSPTDLAYPHRRFDPISKHLDHRGFQINPSLISYVHKHPPDILALAGLSAPTNWLLSILPSKAMTKLLIVESNPDSARRTRGPAAWVKRMVATSVDGYIVTGTRACDYLRLVDPASPSRPRAVLPNIIDPAVFVDRVDRLRTSRRLEFRRALGIQDHEQLWICPARLHESKGLREFLPLLQGSQDLQLLIAGEGHLHHQLTRMIDNLRLPVRLLGQMTENQMATLYAAADLFVLPSLRDPSPLSAIEAAAASLPLFLSTKVGNTPELLHDGWNGWLYDPDHQEYSKRCISSISQTTPDTLATMGRRSRHTYLRHFDSDRTIRAFADRILTIHRHNVTDSHDTPN